MTSPLEGSTLKAARRCRQAARGAPALVALLAERAADPTLLAAAAVQLVRCLEGGAALGGAAEELAAADLVLDAMVSLTVDRAFDH
jgi:hypothetical protein